MNLVPGTAAVLAAFLSLPLADDPVEIKVERAVKKGAAFTLDAKVVRSANHAMNDQDEKSRASISLKGAVKIVDVDAQGRPTKATWKIEKCGVLDKGAEKETQPFPAGLELKIQSKGGTLQFDLGGKSLSEDVMELLALAWPWDPLEGELSEGAVFNPAVKVKAGDPWTPNAAKVVARLAKTNKEVMDPEKTTATAKLGPPATVNGIKCNDVAVTIEITDITYSGHIVGMEPDGGKFSVTLKRSLPVDAKAAGVQWSDTLESLMPMKGSLGGRPATMSFNTRVTRDLTLTPSK